MKKLFFLLFSVIAFGQSKENPIPELKSYVNDFENLFSEAERIELEGILTDYRKESGKEIIIVTTPSTAAYDRHNAANKFRKEKEEGVQCVAIVFSKTEEKATIQRGYEVDTDKFTESESRKIVGSILVPILSGDKFAMAMKAGIEAIRKEL